MKRSLLPAMLLTLLIVRPVPAAPKPPPAPSATDKCRVCGMFVARYPEWTAAVMFGDGGVAYFDGPKDMFAYCLDIGKYNPAKKKSDIASLFVKDYYSLAYIDGRKAFYVIGSDVRGPMGRELVPFEKKSDAQGFLNDHKGKRIVRFGEVTPETLKSLP